MKVENRFIELTLPEAEIGDLYFNKQEISAVFQKQDNGWWQSKDILFLSARNVKDDNIRDILTEYLNNLRIKEQFAKLLNVSPYIIAFALPKEPRGIKKYHGADCWYWLAGSYSNSAATFCYVNTNGYVCSVIASAVGGCSPAFRVGKEQAL
jgi:hypothetical protein